MNLREPLLDLDVFPHPNPWFPNPPRPEKFRFRFWRLFNNFAWIVLTPVGLALLAVIRVQRWSSDSSAANVFGILAVAALVAGTLFWLVGRHIGRAWHSGLILPALIVHASPGRDIRWFESPIAGLLDLLGGAGAFYRAVVESSRYTVRFLLGGEVVQHDLVVVSPHTPFEQNEIAWIAVTVHGQRPFMVVECAPPELAQVAVPESVKQAVREDPRFCT